MAIAGGRTPIWREALTESKSWADVARRLGFEGGSSATRLKGHARRLDLSVDHLLNVHSEPAPEWRIPPADPVHLRRAGSLLAASWFALHGCDVAWPLEPCAHDLLATFDGRPQRIQVKTTTHRVSSTWHLSLTSSRKTRITYDPEEIDFFFGIDGELACYLIPVEKVGGLHAIHLSAYAAYRLDSLQTVA